MEFQILFTVLKKHMSDGDDVPSFFRELMSMITTVEENEWGTSKDPSSQSNEATLRTYSKRGLSQKFARKIVYRLTPEILKSRINEQNETQRRLLAEDLQSYDESVNSDNVGQRVSDWIVMIVQNAAGLTPQTALERQKNLALDTDLKRKYGDYLLAETGGFCPNCGKELSISDNGKIVNVYEVSLIDKGKDPKPENLLAMCPSCHASYMIDDNKKLYKELKSKKSILVTRKQSAHLLDDLPLEKGITDVVTRITKLKEKDFVEVEFDPKEIKKKIDPKEDLSLYITVNNYATTYFYQIQEIMINLDKSKTIDYEEVQDQMRAIYKRLQKSKSSKLEIFEEISAKIQHVTLQDDIYCQIVVSYFIQSCEVF